ncbi:MAG: porin family protein [Gammaproteobacteria bacterium]|nr:porin family protein [Gammaproteobacteria bacterium]
MKLSKTKKIIVGASAMLMVSGAQVVQADDDTGWYVGAGVSRLDADFKDVDDLSFDDSDNTAQIKGGYMFTDIFGVEAGWLDLGDYEGGSGVKIDADGFWLAGVANWSVSERWDLYAKLGVAIVDATSDQVIPGIGPVQNNDTEENIFGGVGAEVDFGNWNIFGEFAVMDTDVSDLNIDIITLGVKYEIGR